MNKTILDVTKAICERSAKSRKIYLNRVSQLKKQGVNRSVLGCSNLAHAIAPMNRYEKESLTKLEAANMAIITAYNDMLSAHEPYSAYPSLLKRFLMDLGATAQVASGVPAMCDGITQGQTGMELSLFSRDNIAMSCAIGLSHNVFDGAFFLGICDKIVPGMVIAALTFGHLPTVFVPSGPMTSGISNKEKAQIRQDFAAGIVDKNTLFKAEAASYHSCGTCTFYGTANSNQMLLEMMGLQLPNGSFVNANTPLRELLTKKAAKTLLQLRNEKISISNIIDEKSFVNAIVGLMATGGSTNHTIHLIAMARAAGIILTWDDFDEISKVTPLLCKMYPNGTADVNAFRDAGGMSVVINQLLKAGLVHNDVQTIVGYGMDNYIVEPTIGKNMVYFQKGPLESRDENVISSIEKPFSKEGGLRVLSGNLGTCIIKTSALKKEQFYIKEKAMVFESQEALQIAFKNGELEKDFVAVVRFQGPKANGMPELHGLMPPLGLLQDKGFKVAILTDGRMSGASGKVPSAIHLSPEAKDKGMISKIKEGDLIEIDIENGKLSLLVDEEILEKREFLNLNFEDNLHGLGRELFSTIRANVGSAQEGASIFDLVGKEKA